MPENLSGFGERRRGFVRVDSQDDDGEWRAEDIEQVFVSRQPTTVDVLPTGDVGGRLVRCGRWQLQVRPEDKASN